MERLQPGFGAELCRVWVTPKATPSWQTWSSNRDYSVVTALGWIPNNLCLSAHMAIMKYTLMTDPRHPAGRLIAF